MFIRVLLIAAFISAPLQGQRVFPGGPAFPFSDSAIVITLGTGTPVPNPERSGPATAVVVGRRVFLFDAGAGVMRRVAAAGLPIDGVTAAFISHLHSDHTLGLPDLMLTSWVMGRSAPMAIHGPPGLKRMTDHVLAAWAEDTVVRVQGLERGRPGGYRVDARETRGGVVFDSGGVKVTAIRVPHGEWEYAFAYRVDALGRRIVISGDTRPCENLVRWSTDVDCLIHECTEMTKTSWYPECGWPTIEAKIRDLQSYHTAPHEIGRIAREARARRLVISHLMPHSVPEELAAAAAAHYAGEVVVGEDLMDV